MSVVSTVADRRKVRQLFGAGFYDSAAAVDSDRKAPLQAQSRVCIVLYEPRGVNSFKSVRWQWRALNISDTINDLFESIFAEVLVFFLIELLTHWARNRTRGH